MDNSIQIDTPKVKKTRKTLAEQDAEFMASKLLDEGSAVPKAEMVKVFHKQLLAAAKRGNMLAVKMLGEISRVYSSKIALDPYQGMTLDDKKRRIQELLAKGEKNGKL